VSLSRRALLASAATALAQGAGAQNRPGAPVLSLKRGVNLWPWFSLTREFPAPRTDYAWPPYQLQRPVPTPHDLARLRTSGLDFARLPVDPGPFLAGAPTERAELMALLRAAVAATLAAGLSLVLNIQANGATHHWNPTRLYASPDAPGLPAYRAFVADCAAMLSGFDASRVALEPVNEPPQGCSEAGWPAIQHGLLAAARSRAPNLTLVATGGCGSMVAGLLALDPQPLQGFAPLLFTFHFYEPYLFSHQGAPWMQEPVYRALNSVPWPASEGSLATTLAAVRRRMDQDAERSAAQKRSAYEETERVLKVYFDADPARPFIDRYLASVKAWGDRHGIAPARILMGEFGALRSDARYVAAAAADRARYVSDVRSSAEAFGFPWAFWNAFDGMGMIEDTSRAFDPAIVSALGLAMPRG